jgi:recombination protein RecA
VPKATPAPKPGGGLDAALADIERKFGKTALMGLDPTEDDGNYEQVPVIDTGSIGLNRALRVGGLARGRIVEIYGPESSGKTGIALSAAARVQRAGGVVAFIDAEHALEPSYAKNLGVDVSKARFKFTQPDSGEQGLEIAEMLIRSGGVALVIIDSVAALTPQAEINGEMGDSHVGLQARLMSQALRKIAGIVNQTKTTVIFINQLREKVGVLFGSPETTTGGKALKFYASVRLDVRRIETLKDSHGEATGNRVRVKVVKNKLGPPFGSCEFDFLYTCGISRPGELIDYGVTEKVVVKSGAWYTYNGVKLGQGREAARRYLAEHEDVAGEIELKVGAKMGTQAEYEPAAENESSAPLGSLTDGTGVLPPGSEDPFAD